MCGYYFLKKNYKGNIKKTVNHLMMMMNILTINIMSNYK